MAATPTLLDRLIGQFSPGAGLRRMRERELLQRAYEAASPRDGWKPRRPGASANADHLADAATIRTKARNLVQNVPYIAGGLEKHVANVIGTGIVPRSLATNADAIDALWSEWGRVADADGERDIYGLMATAETAMEQDGEVLVRLRNRRPEDGLPVPLQLQVLEIDWLDSSKNGTTNGGGTIIGGVEYDVLGRKTAYWLYPHHPGDPQASLRGMLRQESKPVPAAAILHLFNPKRPGQGRGFSRLAPIINAARDLRLYEDAELHRKNLETRLGVIVSGDAEAYNNGLDPEEVKKTGNLGELPSGGILQTTPGVNITTLEPKAAPGYVEYVKHHLHLIAAGMGITYEMLSGDMKEVNFSSARVALLEYRRSVEHLQWLTLIPKLCEPIWRAFIEAAYLAGKVRSTDYRVDWSTPKWDYVNPEQDVKAELAEISGGLSSYSEKLRRRGYKPDLVFSELKKDLERLQKDGTLSLLLALQAHAAALAEPATAASSKSSQVS
ncbi:MAG: phage portal protein [Rhodoferax sp.]|nr:MAG: phage portal protein [Rhodoferax sp.]